MNLEIQNPWWRAKSAIEEDEKVVYAIGRKPPMAIHPVGPGNSIILGPRQVGKTTMVKLLVRDLIMKQKVDVRSVLFFSCEPLADKKDIIELFHEFERIGPSGEKHVFLDEVTYIDDWELAIKYFLENFPSHSIVATGSNALLLKRGAERLPGRRIKVQLFLPLSFREFVLNFGSKELVKELEGCSCGKLDAKGIYSKAKMLMPFISEINSKLRIFLRTGGYPKAIYDYAETGKISEETYETYVKWILGDLSKLDKRESIFRSMAHGIIKNYCTKFSLHSFAKDMEIPSHVTVSEYLDVLQSLLLVNNVYQVEPNKKLPLMRKERKAYFLDPLMYSVLSGYVFGKYKDYSEEMEDKLMEGVVCEALAREARQYLDFSHSLWFFVKHKETDFAMKMEDGKLAGAELKWQGTTSKSDFHNAQIFESKILLTKTDFDFFDDGKSGIATVPAGIFLALKK